MRIPVLVCSERFQVSCLSMNQTSNTDGAPLTESGVIQTTVRTPRRHDRHATTGNFTPQSPEARRRRVWAPRDTSMGTPLNLEANFDATVGAATGVVNPAAASSGLSQDMAALNLVNPAAASSGLSQDMAALNLGVPQTPAALHYCPVPGCISAAGGRRPEWETDGQGLRNHVDAHLLGQIPGLPPESWMNSRRMVVCRVCGRMVSRRFNNGMHRTSHASETSVDLPTLFDICAARIETREFAGASLFPAVEREFNKCTANVIAHSRPDAWQHIGTPADSPDHMRARTVWIEWFMFAKTCLLVLPGVLRKMRETITSALIASLVGLQVNACLYGGRA